MIETPYGIRSEIRYRPSKPVRDANYTRFVKQHPCAACGRSWGIDPAHTGPHGMSQKASDLTCINLCRRCHDAYDADPYGFAERKHLDIPVLIEGLNREYIETVKGRAA